MNWPTELNFNFYANLSLVQGTLNKGLLQQFHDIREKNIESIFTSAACADGSRNVC